MLYHYRLGRESQSSSHLESRGVVGKFVRSVRTAILIEGGVFNTFRTTASVLKNEGWPGFRQRVSAALSRNERNDYQEWIRRYDTLADIDREHIRGKIAQMPQRPLISVLMPTYNTPIDWLQAAIDSVRGQLYENWELCIADDASTHSNVRKVLEKAAGQDERIKVTFRESNGHISAASNSALELCSGNWVALMDHDDLLAEHALYCVAETINRHPEARLVYSDEDKISERGFRFDPYFKCAFNRDLFYSHNMISHLGVYSKGILQKIGGFREGFEGSQDYDLALRFIECIEPRNIVHIPRVLYHWRRHGSSTASGVAKKPYAEESAHKALKESLARLGTPADITAENYGYHVKYVLPEPPPLVSIVVIAGEDSDQVGQFIAQTEQETDYPDFDLSVVCKNSMAAINTAVNDCHGEYIALLDSDTKVRSRDWLTELVAVAAQPGVGTVSAKLLDTSGSVKHAGYVLGLGGVVGSAFSRQPGNSPCYFGRAGLISCFSATSGSCMVLKKSRFQQVDGFEECHLRGAFADIDLCLRLREAGYRNVLNPRALLTQLESSNREKAARGQDQMERDVQYMRKRWGESLVNDPCYSPNLTLDCEDFSLAWPPRVESM